MWSIWGSEMFPKQEDPKGEPEEWSENEMRRWLNAVCNSVLPELPSTPLIHFQRSLFPGDTATREELLARVKANMRAPRT